MIFNPFQKPIGEPLELSDLEELITRQVAEGLYVEYKSVFPANEKIARSIGSFANSYGGWFFVGFEADKANNIPIKVNGVRVSDFPDSISKIRDAVKAHLSPMPAFYSQVISVTDDSVAVVVRIPGKQDKPFISSNGRIYRRAADSSEPVFESDRYVIDKLYAEGKEFEADFADFCDDVTYHNDVEYAGSLFLYVAPYPEVGGTSDVYHPDYAHTLLERSRTARKLPMYWVPETTGNVELVASQPTSESVVLRTADPAKVQGVHATIELFMSGRGKIELPLTFFPGSLWKDFSQLNSQSSKAILEQFVSNNPDDFFLVRLLDVGETVAGIGTLLSYYLDWVGNDEHFSDFRLVVRLQGIRRVIPFFDSDEWSAHVNKLGLPIVTRDSVRIPRGKRAYNFEAHGNLSLHQMACFVVGNALGLPFEVQGSAFLEKYGAANG